MRALVLVLAEIVLGARFAWTKIPTALVTLLLIVSVPRLRHGGRSLRPPGRHPRPVLKRYLQASLSPAYRGMYCYRLFGGLLHSEIPFPELGRSERGIADWTLLRASSPPLAGEPRLLGEDIVLNEVRVRSFRLSGGYRLVYDDTGTFDVFEGGRQIVWCPAAGARMEAVRLDVLGRALPLALHAAGILCLHGSAVVLDNVAIAFLAPKYHGKSTLAQVMVAAGARLATDDVVPVEPGSPAIMRPGVPSARLWSDALERLAPDLLGANSTSGAKRTLDYPSPERIAAEPVPLASIYCLRPVHPSAGERAARRTRLPPLPATLAVLKETKLGLLLGKSEAAALLQRVAALIGSVPVYTLEIARGWDQLPQVVEQLTEWHTPLPLGSATAETMDGGGALR